MDCEEDFDDSKADKKVRKRKKKLYQSIRTQMEFYFSDSNLLKDKFLAKLLNNSQDSSIELSAFLRFNKIRALTNNLGDIASALRRSELLEVSEDGKRIKRTKPVVERDNVDECTIYVEHLPAQTDHSWLTIVFAAFGTITYISLPRYKHTGKLKGFAFIEFDTADSAMKACQHFGGVSDTSQPVSSEVEGSLEKSSKRKREDECPKAVPQTEKDRKKKKRKRKKKQKADEEDDPLALRVMSKTEWKKWRNKYLSLQKATTAQIKKSLLGDNFPEYRNFTPTQEQHQVEEIVVKTLEFQPGVIVHVQLDQPFSSLSDFKKQARTITNVAYVDAAEGDTTIYIRCADAHSADTYVKSTRTGLRGISRILTEDEERTYWDKIQTDRENKFLSKTKRKKRGIEKLMTKAEKIVEKSRHIRFEDE